MALFALVTSGAIDTALAQFNHSKSQSEAIPIDLKKKNKVRVTPFVAPGYSPELQFTLSGGSLVSFSTNRGDTSLLRSSVPVVFTYSTTGSWLVLSNWTTYFNKNRLRITAMLQYRNLADHYFGVGYENGLHTSFPDSTRYNRVYLQLMMKPVWKVTKTLYAGFMIDHNSTSALDVNAHMSKDPYYLHYGSVNTNDGLGVVFSYDTRDFAQNAYRGTFASVTLADYGYLSGKNKYQVIDMDFRKFIPVGKKQGRIIALNIHTRHAFNNVPYGELSFVGSPYDLRGYRYGRYRDLAINFIVVEYRHRFHGNSWIANRSGFVIWGGMGSMGATTAETFSNYLPNLGIGYRFEVQKRLNVRVDFGIGRQSQGFYFNFQEAY